MNSLKARFISLKKRVGRYLHKKRSIARRRIRAFRGRVASSLRRLFTIRRLRLRIRRRRSQRSSRVDSASKTGSSVQALDEERQTQDTRPIVAVPTALNGETSSLSECETPPSVPTLALYPPCTPISWCSSVTPPRSPSLTSWDSWSSMISSSDEEDTTEHSTDSESSLADSVFWSDDEEKGKREDEVGEECVISASVGGQSDHIRDNVFPNESSGIVADCSIVNDGSEYVTVSRSSSEEELIIVFVDEDTDDKEAVSELQNIEPLTPICSPPPPSTAEVEQTRTVNHFTLPGHLIAPPFTAEQERWIVAANHPYKEYVLQTWEMKLQSCLPQPVPDTLSRTSSEEELSMIFGSEDDDENKKPATGLHPVVKPLPHTCPPPAPVTMPEIQSYDGSFQSENGHSCLTQIPAGDSSRQPCCYPCPGEPSTLPRSREISTFTTVQVNTTPSLPLTPLESVGSQSKRTPKSKGSKPPPLTLTPLSSSGGTKPAPLTLSLTDPEDSVTTPNTPPPPPGPSTAEKEQMWNDYVANRSTAPEYFLYPPFTPEQEEWIVQFDHPFKEYVLQTWQTGIHSSMQGWLEDLVN